MEIANVILSKESNQVIQDGAWVGNLFGADETVRLKVRGMQSKTARETMLAKLTEMRMANEGKPLTVSQKNTAYAQTMAEACLMDWEGFTSGGKPFPFDAALASQWLTSKEEGHQRFQNMVAQAVNQIDLDASSFVEEVSKN